MRNFTENITKFELIPVKKKRVVGHPELDRQRLPYPKHTPSKTSSTLYLSMAAAAASLLHLATSACSPPRVRLVGPTTGRRSPLRAAPAPPPPRAYKVTIEHGGESRVVEVEEGETILSRALDEGIDVPHDCKLGVCMTCPARLVAGEVDQSDGMLSDDVVAQGYALLCASYPRSDCTIRVIPEDELLKVQLATADD